MVNQNVAVSSRENGPRFCIISLLIETVKPSCLKAQARKHSSLRDWHTTEQLRKQVFAYFSWLNNYTEAPPPFANRMLKQSKG